jgi:acetoin utilization deacetylase AcuC-like enzyme
MSTLARRHIDSAPRGARRQHDSGAKLLMVTQRRGHSGAVPWILDGQGRRTPGYDDERRLSEVQAGLMRHAGVRARTADVGEEQLEQVLGTLHDPAYLRALGLVDSEDPVLVPGLAEPGLQPDTPVCARVLSTAREGVATAITAARHTVAGDRFTYALCRPPGHHAGPSWLGGYCYLNNSAAAALTLHTGGVRNVGILDLDLHYPNGTSAIVEHMPNTTLHSLHGSTGANLPWERVRARTEREHLVAFRTPPDLDTYLAAVAACILTLASSTDAIVLALGYDTVAGDPHGSWSFQPELFAQIGRLLAASRLPVCVVQEGGYALAALAECSHAFATGLLDGDPAWEIAI